MILQSKKLRFIDEDAEGQKNLIEIDPQWEAELKEFPQFTRKYP